MTAPRKLSKSALLRTQLRGPSPVRAIGAHDGLTAKLAERAGFEAVWASSLELSASHGVPDASLLSMTQYLDAAEVIDAAVGLPVLADCDTGFGGPLNVAHTVRRYERRGIAGICIEDKVFPKINSFAEGAQDLVTPEEFALKIKFGKEAQQDPDFVLVARTEALICGLTVDAALHRAWVYAAAGADAVLVHSKSERPDEVLEFGARWDLSLPLVAVPTTYNTVHEQELYDAGYRVVIYANQGLRAAINGVSAMLSELARARRGQAVEDQIATLSEVFELQGTVPIPRP